MGKALQADRPARIHVALPESLLERLDSHLRSQVLDRIPYGARSDLIASLLVRYLDLVEGEK